MSLIPAPTTFAEGQRAIYGWLMAAAGIFCGIAFAGLILLLWLGGWSAATEGQRIAAVAMLGAGFPVGMLSVIIALAVGGPVGRFKVQASSTGVDLEASVDGSAFPTPVAAAAPKPADPDPKP